MSGQIFPVIPTCGVEYKLKYNRSRRFVSGLIPPFSKGDLRGASSIDPGFNSGLIPTWKKGDLRSSPSIIFGFTPPWKKGVDTVLTVK